MVGDQKRRCTNFGRSGWHADFPDEDEFQLVGTAGEMEDSNLEILQQDRMYVSSPGPHSRVEPDPLTLAQQKADYLEGGETRQRPAKPRPNPRSSLEDLRPLGAQGAQPPQPDLKLRNRSARELFHTLLVESHESELLELADDMSVLAEEIGGVAPLDQNQDRMTKKRLAKQFKKSYGGADQRDQLDPSVDTANKLRAVENEELYATTQASARFKRTQVRSYLRASMVAKERKELVLVPQVKIEGKSCSLRKLSSTGHAVALSGKRRPFWGPPAAAASPVVSRGDLGRFPERATACHWY